MTLSFLRDGHSVEVEGIVDLARHDSKSWDSLPAWQRSRFRFPGQIGPNEMDSLVVAVAMPRISLDG